MTFHDACRGCEFGAAVRAPPTGKREWAYGGPSTRGEFQFCASLARSRGLRLIDAHYATSFTDWEPFEPLDVITQLGKLYEGTGTQ
jgi:hypothetical protein